MREIKIQSRLFQTRKSTNSAGILTLFRERPFEHCTIHECEADEEGFAGMCRACWHESGRRIEEEMRGQRISEIREAIEQAMVRTAEFPTMERK